MHTDQTELFTEDDAARIQGYKPRMIQLLRAGPLTNAELTQLVTHRFSAVIHNLRADGHHITSERVKGGTWRFRYHGHEPTTRVTQRQRSRYYASSHWRNKRRERLEFDAFQCVQCHARENLEVHHWKYELFDEQLTDLATLCRDCHEICHQNPNISVHFPRNVRESIAEKLEALGDAPTKPDRLFRIRPARDAG